MPNLKSLAEQLYAARSTGKPISQLSRSVDFSPTEAYEIQHLQLAMEKSPRVGWKMGLTSKAKREQMNLHSPLYGYLLQSMQINGGLSLRGLIHPKVEPEIAFLMRAPLKGEVSYEQARGAIEAVAPALEVLDSRYDEFKYFSLQDVIADNSSSCRYVIGEWLTDWRAVDLKNLKMDFQINGETRELGTSSAISGDPVVSLMQLASLLNQRNLSVNAGEIVLAGAATAAVALQPGLQASVIVEKLGSVSMEVELG